MERKLLSVLLISASLFSATSCSKNTTTSANTSNISSQVSSNLSNVSSGYTPQSITNTSSTTSNVVRAESNPCAGTTDWAVCQSDLISAYLQLGKGAVEAVNTWATAIGNDLGQVADGSAATSADGKVSYNKTNSTDWSVLVRNSMGASLVYIAIANATTYHMQVNNAVNDTNPTNMQIDVAVNYTDANTWDATVFVSNGVCNPTDPGAPSDVQIYVSKHSGLWWGKVMLYSPRWLKPGTSVDCTTAAGTDEIAMYTEFVGNDVSTKAALYMVPPSVTQFDATTKATYAFNNFCTLFSSACNVVGGPTASYFSSNGIQNNWCTTGPGTQPTWNNNCTTNAAVSSANFAADTLWIAPSVLKTKTVTLPTTL